MWWGQTTLFDCTNADLQKVASLPEILEFLSALVEVLDMEAHGNPVVERFGISGGSTYGYTAVQLITTSHIAAHFCECTGEIYLDVTSCKPYSARSVEWLLSMTFGKNLTVRTRQIERDAQLVLQYTTE